VSEALLIQHTKCMCCITLSSVACLALPYLSILSKKWHDFRKNIIEQYMCVLIFSQFLSETFFTRRRTEQDTAIHAHRTSCKVPVNLSDIN
jgi:uncharacterized membrane protein YhaH (DUF805 family)